MVQEGLRSGALTLKETRLRLHISQGRLAERSGVSERTIRGLESGDVRNPHPSTLLALATALQITGDEMDHFLRVWEGWGELPPYQQVLAVDSEQGPDESVQEGLVRSFFDKRVVAATRVVRVGPHRQILSERYLTTIEALTDGVSSHLIVASLARAHQRPDLLQVVATEGCAVETSTFDPATHAVQVQLSLGRSLRTGEQKTIGWQEVNGWADLDRPDQSFVDTQYVNRFLRPVTWVSMQVLFEGPIPRRIVPVDGSPVPVGLEMGAGRELTADAFGAVSVQWQNSAAGRFGLQWDWD